MSNLQLFIDIETISSDTMPSLDDIKVPATYKIKESIDAYKLEKQLEQYKKQALDSMEGRIICFGCCMGDGMPVATFINEERLLMDSADNIIVNLSGGYLQPITFIGWNISTFDIPWLWRKAIQYNLPKLRNALPHGNKNMVIDLMRVFAVDFKDYVKLKDCARFLNISHDDTFTGADVYDAWKAGDLEKIANHCKDDIQTCMEIYRRILG
jgi:predicted PolB exonuclease-like 3'-5' exonuclease